MKILVIHPKDHTTDFLREIYKDLNGATVINEPCSKSHLKQSIKEHDFIVMLGHGTEKGLIGHKRMVIDSTFVYLLREKPNAVYVWCNADRFVNRYGLRGFNTGMIISEYEEALNFAVQATDEEINISNKFFAEAIRDSFVQASLRVIMKMPEVNMCEMVRSRYRLALDETGNPVIDFNIRNLQYR